MKIFIVVISFLVIGCSSTGPSKTTATTEKISGFWNKSSQSGNSRGWTCIDSLSFQDVSCN